MSSASRRPVPAEPPVRGHPPAVIDVRLVDHPVDAAPLPSFPADCGAECVFLGRTRAGTHAEHGPLVELTYEAHPALATSGLATLAGRAVREHGARAVRLLHATGPVPVGSASVLVQVACGHRAEAFAACRMLIDELKKSVPIWKREVWADGSTWAAGVPLRPDAPAKEEPT